MKSFIKFLYQQNLMEGGNLTLNIDGQIFESDKIDLTVLHRTKVVERIKQGLKEINALCKKQENISLWNTADFSPFLSGSTLHLFNDQLKKFESVKKSVGDIDVMVNEEHKDELSRFLSSLKFNEKVGPFHFIGFKPSGDQFITLWKMSTKDLLITDESYKDHIFVQIDLELVEFDEKTNKKTPSEWSTFSHSSPWEDLVLGIKGVFRHYILRAVSALKKEKVFIRSIKTKKFKYKEEPVEMSPFAFSLKGLRIQLKPVMIDGKQELKVYAPDKQVYKVYYELDSKDGIFIRDFDTILTYLFSLKNDEHFTDQHGDFEQFLKAKKMNAKISKNDIQSFTKTVDTLYALDLGDDIYQKIIQSLVDMVWGDPNVQSFVKGNILEDCYLKLMPIAYILFKMKAHKSGMNEFEQYKNNILSSQDFKPYLQKFVSYLEGNNESLNSFTNYFDVKQGK